MLASARQRSTTAGGAETRTPSASNTSALPQRLETDRFPCFATRTPQEATTSATQDETLNVPDRSPPVPQVSNTPSWRRESGTALGPIPPAEPPSLSRRSPFNPKTPQNPPDSTALRR